MGDSELRELERRWKETGAVEDEASYLQGLVRTGLIGAADLRLAAYLGQPAAGLACSGDRPSVPTEVGDWIRGLEGWGADLAIWAVAEAALAVAPVDLPSNAREHYEGVSRAAQGRLQSGGLPVPSEPDFLDTQPQHTAYVKLLRLALHSRARDPRYPGDGDPEVLAATRRIEERFPILDPQKWRYNHAELHGSGWVHVFRYLRAPGRETRQQVPATEGWEPAGDRFCLSGRQGVLGSLIVRFDGHEDAVRERVRACLLPWALRGVPGHVARRD